MNPAALRRARSFALALPIVIGCTLRLLAEGSAVPDYQIGDTATNDLAAPFRLLVLDPQRTATMRETEALRVQPFFRFNPDAGPEAETNLHAAFVEARARFLDAVDANFKKRKLYAPGVASQRFGRLVDSFQKQHKSFPLTTNLARLWALGDSGAIIESTWSVPLREAMTQALRSDGVSGGGRLSASQVRLLTLSAASQFLDLPGAEKQSKLLPRTNLVTLSKARQALQQDLIFDGKVAARFVAGFLKENCILDAELTQQARAKRTNQLWAIDHFEPGQLIVRRGQPIDARVKLALDELRTRIASDEAHRQAVDDQRKSAFLVRQMDNEVIRATARAEAARRQGRWLAGGLIVSFCACVIGWWRFSRRRWRSLPLAVVPLSQGSAVLDEWQQRALAAEKQAGQAKSLMRALVFPHFARWLSGQMIQRLIFQRARLLTSHERAEIEVAQLEKRLLQLNAPLQERFRAYEQRIAELELELGTKNEENRELIKATIASTRKKLESERAKQPLAWN